jgi:hypothetical protein
VKNLIRSVVIVNRLQTSQRRCFVWMLTVTRNSYVLQNTLTSVGASRLYVQGIFWEVSQGIKQMYENKFSPAVTVQINGERSYTISQYIFMVHTSTSLPYVLRRQGSRNHWSVPNFRKSVLGQVHSLYQRKFSKEQDLVFPVLISSIFLFPYSHPVAAYVFFLFLLSLLYYLLSLLQ